MTQKERAKAEERRSEETFVIAEVKDGYRVSVPGDRNRIYLVRPDGKGLSCSCGEYLQHADSEPEYQCSHIRAVMNQRPDETNGTRDAERYDTEERRAIQEENGKPKRKKIARSASGPTQMVVKRSVSPDGRIDSLSVEFTAPVEPIDAEAIKAKARTILNVQADIMQDFLGRNGKAETPRPTSPQDTTEPAVPARLLRIEGMEGKWGRRLFLMVQVNGETTRLFGSRKQLAEALGAAGYARTPETLAEGMELNLPCRVTTKPSPDGRFVNIDRVFSAETSRTQARAR